jgi:hypothetical protein
MKVQIKKEVTSEVEIKCPVPKYVRYFDNWYYKFHEQGDMIIQTYYKIDLKSIYPFNVQVKTNDIDMAAFNVEDNHFEVSEAEYYNNLRACLQKYGVFDFTPLNEDDVPTLFTQSN